MAQNMNTIHFGHQIPVHLPNARSQVEPGYSSHTISLFVVVYNHDPDKKQVVHSEVSSLVNNVLNNLNVSTNNCHNTTSPFIIIIKRNNERKILNAGVLRDSLVKEGFTNTEVRLISSIVMHFIS